MSNESIDYCIRELSYLIDNFETTYIYDIKEKLQELKTVLKEVDKSTDFKSNIIEK